MLPVIREYEVPTFELVWSICDSYDYDHLIILMIFIFFLREQLCRTLQYDPS